MKTNTLAALCLAIASVNAGAAPVNVPVPIDYRLIRDIMLNQLFTAEGQTARLWHDKHNCSFVNLVNPRMSGQEGQVKIVNTVHTKFGTSLAGKCLPVAEWHGELATLQQPTLNADGSELHFPITQLAAYDDKGRELKVAELLNLIKNAAQPKLSEVKVDLKKTRHDLEKALSMVVTEEHKPQLDSLLNSLKFDAVTAEDSQIRVNVRFEAPTGNKKTTDAAAAFDEDELEQSQALWQHWETAMTWAINEAPVEGHRDALLSVLKDAGVAFKSGLTAADTHKNDPVRSFFNDSWNKLAPTLRALSQQVPGAEGLRYLTYLAATDLMYQLDTSGAPLGLTISSDSLRRVTRVLLANRQP